MKKRFLFVLAIICMLTFTGCKESKSKTGTLSAPQQVTVQSDGDKSLIIFDEVKNADYYDIYINDVCITVKSNGTGTIQFDASKIITLPQKYTIKVKAGSESYFDSAFTEEYEYNHTGILDAPVISIDGTTLNWNKISNAEFYDVVVISSNPTIETTHRFTSNSFNFTNILANKGEYLFKVRAISESGEYLSSIYSNQVRYIHTITLETPHNLSADYDVSTGEMLLSFVSSENVDNFTINIDGINYSFAQNEITNFLYPDDLSNVYIIKLSSFAKYKGLTINSSTLMSVSVKANTSNQYLKSSDFSDKITCQFVNILPAPQVNTIVDGTTCKINIAASDSEYLGGFAIYLNNRKYKTLSKEITQIELPLSEIGTSGIRIQSISNNNNCYSSQLSAVKYADSKLTALGGVKNLAFANDSLSWTSVANATSYCVQISNSLYVHTEFTTETTLDLSSLCKPSQYVVKVIAMGDGYKQSETQLNVNYTTQLDAPSNVSINTIGDRTNLYFDEVDNAYGYLIYLNNTRVNRLFVSSPININAYISEANSYNVKIKAVNTINQFVQDSALSTEQVIESVKTLSSPTLTIVQDSSNNKYYLNVEVDENEKQMASSYEVWINYQSIGEEPFQDAMVDITSYFTNAGQYNFMVKAKAVDSPYIKDSNIASITYNCIKQLDTVTDINVTKLEDESKYILTFKEQTLAAKYLVRIVKGDDESYNAEFEISHGMADISAYLVDNGVYRIYVKAVALEGSFYTDSATSGNPYRLTKGETLSIVENISIDKTTGITSTGAINLTWDSVPNSSGYQVYIYYHSGNDIVLKKSIFVSQSETPILNIGSGEHKCINKEGSYTIQIKALGDGVAYETGQTATAPYIYVMESPIDFERNTIFMYGNTYNYRVKTADDLKNLLYYHYLYNDDVWQYNTLQYNLKVYCNEDLDVLASTISESVATQVESVFTPVEKMNIIAQSLLNQYPEISNINLGFKEGNVTQAFCLNESANVYIFKYQDVLDKDKSNTIGTIKQVYKDKLDTVDTFDQRPSTYVFEIDKQEMIDVTTTEQLFMALQYNRQPNFIGDCDVAKAVYENARFVLRQICSDNMSDYQKTLQIYDFLTKRIVLSDVNKGAYDENVILGNQSSILRANLKDFYLEGILYNASSANGLYISLDEFVGVSAESAGLAKTFVALCSIEGIDSIKVNGEIKTDINGEVKTINYSWNKVYIDIEEDGVDGKRWYAIDLASAMKNSISIRKGGVTSTYQASVHKYFLITDAGLNLQATSWHKRLGDNTDYVANTTFNYYTSQRYSCVYNSNTIVDNANFKASSDTDVINSLMHAMLKANKKHRVTIDIDAKEYINNITGGATDDTSLASVVSRITGTIYETARTTLGGQYNCHVNAAIVDARYIVIVVESINYKG